MKPPNDKAYFSLLSFQTAVRLHINPAREKTNYISRSYLYLYYVPNCMENDQDLKMKY